MEYGLSICRQYTLVKTLDAAVYARCLKCRSWSCQHCQPHRRRQLMAQAAAGAPQRFITLTIDPSAGGDQESRLKLLSHAWKVIIKRLRREHPHADIEYMAVVEQTEAGEPHLHILARCPYIPQRVLSNWMRELAHSPIVDIRRVTGVRQAVRYVAKYIAKAPAQFGAAKRYWQSRHYAPEDPEYKKGKEPIENPWTIIPYELRRITLWLTLAGYALRTDGEDRLLGQLTPGHPPLDWQKGGWYDPLRGA